MKAMAAVLMLAAGTAAAETRCGWIDNPTPGNWWLTDAAGEWVLGLQGGPQAEGMEAIPDLTVGEWVATNGSYGYGCICLEVQTHRAAMRVTRVLSARPLPLARCTADPALPGR